MRLSLSIMMTCFCFALTSCGFKIVSNDDESESSGAEANSDDQTADDDQEDEDKDAKRKKKPRRPDTCDELFASQIAKPIRILNSKLAYRRIKGQHEFSDGQKSCSDLAKGWRLAPYSGVKFGHKELFVNGKGKTCADKVWTMDDRYFGNRKLPLSGIVYDSLKSDRYEVYPFNKHNNPDPNPADSVPLPGEVTPSDDKHSILCVGLLDEDVGSDLDCEKARLLFTKAATKAKLASLSVSCSSDSQCEHIIEPHSACPNAYAVNSKAMTSELSDSVTGAMAAIAHLCPNPQFMCGRAIMPPSCNNSTKICQ